MTRAPTRSMKWSCSGRSRAPSYDAHSKISVVRKFKSAPARSGFCCTNSSGRVGLVDRGSRWLRDQPSENGDGGGGAQRDEGRAYVHAPPDRSSTQKSHRVNLAHLAAVTVELRAVPPCRIFLARSPKLQHVATVSGNGTVTSVCGRVWLPTRSPIGSVIA
jgi:hypothetical protein